VDASRVELVAKGESIVSFGRDPRNGDVLLASLWDGKILRLVRNPAFSK
jgi:hypothetical protein